MDWESNAAAVWWWSWCSMLPKQGGSRNVELVHTFYLLLSDWKPKRKKKRTSFLSIISVSSKHDMISVWFWIPPSEILLCLIDLMLSARGLSAQQSCISGLLMNAFLHHGWVGLGAAFCFFFRYHEISIAKKWGNVEEAACTFRNLQHPLQMTCLWLVTLQGGLSSLRLRWDHDFGLAVPTSSNCSLWSLA